MRRIVISMFLFLLVAATAACSSAPTLSEYGEELEALVVTQNARLDELDAQVSGSASPDEDRTYARERMLARRTLIAGLEDLSPPDSIADLHAEAIEILVRLADAEAVLADKVESAESVASVDDLWNTPEGVAARTADERAILICEAAEGTFDRTKAGAEFEDVPWIPAELKEVVDVVLGCRAEERR